MSDRVVPEARDLHPLRRTAILALAGMMAALIPALGMFGFTVDDALITARYAAHLAAGVGYRFNAAGPVTDGVTPLGFPFLLAPFAREGPLSALAAAKVLGLLAWTLASGVLAIAIDRGPLSIPSHRPAARRGWSALLLIAASVALAAWSVAGMETGLVTALAALAVALPELGLLSGGALCAGLSAALRPELFPWALVVAAAPSPRGGRTTPMRVALAVVPFLIVVAVRVTTFGRAAPLSVFAKPSTPGLGAEYALACFLLAGPVVLLAPFAWARLGGWARGLLIAVLVHFTAVAFAGGDWMPASRLIVPVLPTVVLGAAHLAVLASSWSTALRTAIAVGLQLFQASRVVPAGTTVGVHRRRVLEELRAPLVGAKVIAALDIGWLGATTDATLVDLAGLTDPAIAVLPGGHTSKAIPAGLIDARGVDAIVLLIKEGESLVVPWTDTYFARVVELRIAGMPGIGEAFVVAAKSDLPHLRYVVLRRVEGTGR